MRAADKTRNQLMEDLAWFSHFQKVSKDVDPVYPVLGWLYAQPGWDYDLDEMLWGTLMYVAYYNLPSAYRFLRQYSTPEHVSSVSWDSLRMPTGIERRGLRGGANMLQHLMSLQALWQSNGCSLANWLKQGFNNDPRHNWACLQATLQQANFNGRWAAYKTGEILMKVHGFPVMPTDMGMAFSSGPRWGLDQFYGHVAGNSPTAIRLLDVEADDLQKHLRQDYQLELGLEELETMLCDFHSLYNGRYYVGHDIDQLQEQLTLAGEGLEEVWQARLEALPHAYLGELGGWLGVDKERKKVYRDSGKVLIRP